MSRRLIAAAVAALLLTGAAQAVPGDPQKALAPIPASTVALMRARDTHAGAPILMRAFKKEGEIEVWKLARHGRYVLLKTFPICRWSGQLGPKRRMGDRQTPEGFYSVGPKQMNPNSSYYLSFDVGYPNAYDRAHGSTGSYLMVHGTCSSAGCFAMTDAQIAEIYAIARDAFAGGQRQFQFHAYPFRMTAPNMARARSDQHIAFWRQLKEGYDRFEATGEELPVGVSNRSYAFAPYKNPASEALAQARVAAEMQKTAALVADGAAAVRITYIDGGMHAAFASLSRRGVPVGAISRPETLGEAGREVVVTAARHRPKPVLVASKPVAPDPDSVAALFSPVPLSGPALAGAGLSPVMDGASAILPATLVPAPLEKVALRGA